MRIRSIKPEFWRSADIGRLPWDIRLLFIGLWSYVDDNGVGLDRMVPIVADLFAEDLSIDPTETLRRVSEGLDALEEAGMITRYSVNGKGYLHIFNWEKHQRVQNPNKPRYPLPTSDNIDSTEGLHRDSIMKTETLGSVTGEQGNRGTEEQRSVRDPESADPAPSSTMDEPIRDDVERICEKLRDRVVANGARKTATKITAGWRTSARLLIDRDQVPIEDIERVIDWCQDSSFWKANIQSMPKLRDKFDTLNLQSKQSPGNDSGNKSYGGW